MIDIEELKKMRKSRQATEFNIYMKHCLMKTMEDNRDIGATTPRAMEACAFVHRNRNIHIEPRDTNKRIRMFLTGEIDLKDPRWVSTKKERERRD